jgi:hypothetical protein
MINIKVSEVLKTKEISFWEKIERNWMQPSTHTDRLLVSGQRFWAALIILCGVVWLDRLCGLVVSGFDSRHYQKKKVVDLERGPLTLVSTTEELLDRKVAAPD